jgi:hypothetical protein
MNIIKMHSLGSPPQEPGQLYVDIDTGDMYIVATIYNKFALISLKDGNRYIDPVDNISNIFGNGARHFTSISTIIEIIPE